MRDFKNGGDIHVGGDFTVTDNSQQHKLLIHCSTEELFLERPFRQENVLLEQKRKIKRLKPFYGLSVLLFVAAALWAWFSSKSDFMSFLMGAASLFIGYASLKATFEQNAFQKEEQSAVNEINKILKQRRVEE